MILSVVHHQQQWMHVILEKIFGKNNVNKKGNGVMIKITHIIHLATPSKADSFVKDFRSTLTKYLQMMDLFEKLCYSNKRFTNKMLKARTLIEMA